MRAWRSAPDSRRRTRSLAGSLIAVTALAGAILAAVPSAATAAVPSAATMPSAAGPQVNVLGADLVNASTGARLWSKDLNVRRPMASITKVMTALVVLQAGNLNRKITVTSAAVQYVQSNGASNAGLIAGDVLTARQLLAAMLLPSGCDAAYLLATSYGPGRGAFVAKMNAAAKKIGLRSTHFAHFDGLPIPTGSATYSTPADLVKLGEQAMSNSVLRSIVALHSYAVAATAQHHHYVWVTTDGLIGTYRGAIGIKTGNTKAAGFCLLFEARRGKRALIGVVLHVNPISSYAELFATSRQVLNWGFSHM
jgi:D-alanyl-D-alanine carboxypeptidase (penicillin-binding protein 5/6)